MRLYGLDWPQGTDLAIIEMKMIRAGGYIQVDGEKFGEGLFHHYRALQMALWPEGEQHHRWSDIMLKEILANRITVIGGCRDSGKTHVISRYALTDYFTFPNNTLTLISSTDARGIQLRVYGDLKDMFARAKETRPWLPGHVVESKLGLFTDDLAPGATVRDQRKGLICIPVVGGDGENLEGLDRFIGVKQERRRLLGDECQFMAASYLNVMANLDKGDFKGVFVGNFLGGGDPLDRLAEPVGGWSSHPEPKKTEVWETKLGGRCINLVGTDSPNYDYPQDEPPRYPYLLSWEDEKRTSRRYGTDSLQYWSQIKGIRKSDLMAHRVLTIDLCRKCGAFDSVIWLGEGTTKVYALDAAYGGDRAVGGMIEFGKEVKGTTIIKCHPPRTIPILVSELLTPEMQLATAVKQDCDGLGIPASNVYFDAGMRATLGVHMANVVGGSVCAINFGGSATPRPVSASDFVYDEKERRRRLRRCDEAYSKFVTELAWSVRMVVEHRQMREIPEDVVREFEMREWYKVTGDRIELETKADTRKRMGSSPDLADWLAIGVEGARRLGFQIEGLPDMDAKTPDDEGWLSDELAKFRRFTKSREINYGVK